VSLLDVAEEKESEGTRDGGTETLEESRRKEARVCRMQPF